MIRRRIALIYWVIALGVFTPGAVYAYIDPATTTYIIQIITALVVTVGVSLSIFLYRFRMISAKVRYGLYGLWYRLRTKGEAVAGGGLFAGLLRRGDAASRNDGGGDAASRNDGGGDAAPRNDGGGDAAPRNDRGSDAAPRNDGGGTAAPSPCVSSEPSPCVPYIVPDYVLPGAARPPTAGEMAALGEPLEMQFIKQRELGIDVYSIDSYAKRLKTAFPVVLASCLTFGLFGCTDLFFQNSEEMPFGLSSIMHTLLIATFAMFTVILIVVSLLRNRLYIIALLLLAAGLIAGYIQGSYINKGLGELTGEMISFGNYKGLTIVSVLFWICVFGIVFFSAHRSRKVRRVLFLFVPILLIIIQGAGLTSLALEKSRESIKTNATWYQRSTELLTTEGMTNPASGKNAIVFILDQMDQNVVEQIELEQPGFFNSLDGFTQFDDCISYYYTTFPSVTAMVTGIKHYYDCSMSEYFDYAWANAKMMNELKQSDVGIWLYSDLGFLYDDPKQVNRFAKNANKGHLELSQRIALVKLLKLSAFRHAPMPMKQTFWVGSGEFIDSISLSGEYEVYSSDDFYFYDTIVRQRLSPSDSDKGFFFYHLRGAHLPFNMDENIQRIDTVPDTEEETKQVKQAIGSFKIVYEYLDQLKELGLYKDATIIITADHGNKESGKRKTPSHVALFVKPAGTIGTPLAYSHAPVSPDQLPRTVLEGLFGETGSDFPPGYLDVEESADMIREFGQRLYRYEIRGDGRDFSNWNVLGLYASE